MFEPIDIEHYNTGLLKTIYAMMKDISSSSCNCALATKYHSSKSANKKTLMQCLACIKTDKDTK